MEEKEINKILKPKKTLIILLLIYLSIAFACIGAVFFIRFFNQEEEAINLSELALNNYEKEEQYVEVDIETLPILMMCPEEKENQFYYVTDITEHTYIVKLSNQTFKDIVETLDQETGRLKSIYQLKGITKSFDESIKNLVISNRSNVFNNNGLNLDNFAEQLGEFYIKENRISERIITLCKISALFGVFFLILAIGYIVPAIIKVNKTLRNKELVEDLREELRNLTDMPYKEQHIYLTKNYIVSGIQVIKYDEVIWGYVEEEKKYGMTVGRNLMVHDENNKKYMVGSVVGSKNDILDYVLADIKSRNANMKVGYNGENKEFFEKV